MKTTPSVEDRYYAALAEAEKKLSTLEVVCGRPINLKGLRGWIFEQTVRTCLEDEIERHGIDAEISEQARIGGRATVDLLFGHVAIEVKTGGFFSDVGDRYLSYRKAIEAKGWHYFYLTLEESYSPYAKIAERTFGNKRAFFLDRKGEWGRFLSEILPLLKANQSQR